MKKYLCELFGTFVLVLFGTGVAVFTQGDLVATALAFGLVIVGLAYVIGDVSGCHVNPAVTIAMLFDKRISLKDAVFYFLAQIVGALLGTATLYFLIKNSKLGDVDFVGLGANGYGTLSASGIGLKAALLVEFVLTFVFVFAILGVTKDSKKSAVAPIVIGLTLTLVHLLGIKLTGTSVNPARSFAPAVFMRGTELKQVWVFIVAPLVGGIFAAAAYRLLYSKCECSCDCECNECESKEEPKKIEEPKETTKTVKKVTKKTTTKKTTKK